LSHKRNQLISSSVYKYPSVLGLVMDSSHIVCHGILEKKPQKASGG